MKILAIVTGEYGIRHVENIKANGPDSWQIYTWKTPPVFPRLIPKEIEVISSDRLTRSSWIASLPFFNTLIW